MKAWSRPWLLFGGHTQEQRNFEVNFLEMEMIDDIDIQNQFSDNGWAQIGAIGGDSCIDRRQRDFEMKD